MTNTPSGNVTIQTLAMPKDTNANGDIFGGWLVSQMDLAAGVLAKRLAKGRVATIAIHSMTFLKPVHVGDVIKCYATLLKQGHSSMTIQVQVWAESIQLQETYQVTEGTFVFVAIDNNGQPRPVVQ